MNATDEGNMDMEAIKADISNVKNGGASELPYYKYLPDRVRMFDSSDDMREKIIYDATTTEGVEEILVCMFANAKGLYMLEEGDIEFFVCKQVVLDEENYGGKLYITIYAPWENVGKWFASGIEK